MDTCTIVFLILSIAILAYLFSSDDEDGDYGGYTYDSDEDLVL